VFTAVFFSGVILAVTVFADGYRNPPEGAAVLGTSGMRLSYGDDPSAVSHNPANLMDLKKPQVMPSVTFGYSVKELNAAGFSEESEDPWAVLPAFYGAWPDSRGRYVLGLGVNSPYGQSTEWDKDGMVGRIAPYFSEISTINVTPAIGARLGNNILIGAGIGVMYSELDFRQFFAGNKAGFDAEGYGVGGNAGITVKMPARQRIAITYRSSVRVDYDGDFSMLPAASGDFDTEIDFPAELALGYGVEATEKLRLEANVEWVEHSKNDEMVLDLGKNNAMLEAALGTRTIEQDWEDTWTFGVGAKWSPTPAWSFRTGWTYLPTPVVEETFMPSWAEGDKHVIGTGLGFSGDAHSLDLAYAYNICDDRDINNPAHPVTGQPYPFNGEYDFEAHLLSVSYIYRF
jgi:long-chain fatty acid transport protein